MVTLMRIEKNRQSREYARENAKLVDMNVVSNFPSFSPSS